jgi:tetratricopeptide (TPR) repeat protein
LDEALATIRQEKVDEGQLSGLAAVYYAMGRKAESDEALKAMQTSGSYFPSDFARIYAFRGEPDRAMAYFEKAYETHDPFLWYIKGDPIVRRLEGDPRYRAFLRNMNLLD